MKQLNVKDCAVVINGIRQNCYALDTRKDITDIKSNHIIKTYDSLEKKVLPNGYVEEVVKKDYPINPDSIASYVDGADYRRDPMQAIANSPKRINLGDVREVQDFVQGNPQDAVRVLRGVIATLEKKQQASQQASQQTSLQETSNNVNKGE